MIAATPATNVDRSASAAIERLLGRFSRYVPAFARSAVVAIARDQFIIPPASFSARLRERGYRLEPADTLELWAAVLWAIGDE